jgi:exodeoxyribonuclease VII small subunit
MTDEIARMSFEEAFRALQQAVDALESGNLPLEQALEVFERGMALARRCAEHLDQAELRVRQLQWGAAPAEASPFAFPEDQEPPF